MFRKKICHYALLTILIVGGFFVFRTSDTFATSEIDTLKSQISERNSRLKDIEQEIANYQTELKKVGGEKSTLQKAISRLELERKKVEAEINYTQNKISTTNLEISKIGIEIGSTQKKIELNHHAIRQMMKVWWSYCFSMIICQNFGEKLTSWNSLDR